MDVVASHEGTDFDAFASMVAIAKLFPGTQILLGGSVNRNVRHFLSLYGKFFPYLREKDVDWKQIKKVYVVDTPYLERLGKLGELSQKEDVKLFLFDHHPEEKWKGKPNFVFKEYGACTTIMVEMIQDASFPLSPLEATLFLIGIYEDTGFFTFPTTTSNDLKAASFLVAQGAMVSYVPRFTRVPLTPEQREALQKMIQSLSMKEIRGIPIHFCQVKFSEYVDGVSLLVHKLMDLEEIEVLFALLEMENKVYVIARSRLEDVNLTEIVGKLGGGGHRSAASVAFKDKSLKEVRKEIFRVLYKSLSFTRAKEIMSQPVKVIFPEQSVEEAFLTMIRFGFSGLPVVDKEGKLVGMIARRDVEKAMYHGLKRAPVKSFMSTHLITVSPEDSVFRVRQLMVEKDIGRIPVVKGNTVLGLITRSDILRIFHDQENVILKRLTRLNFAEKLYLHFDKDTLALLNTIGTLAKKMGVKTYLVGGVVRDIILGYPNYDLDFVVEGDAIEFVQSLHQSLPGKVVPYPPFGTAILFLKDGKRIDFASARHEFYPSPGAPPQVEYSNLRRDLFRRDFTINAMAISIHPDNWGELFDFFGGLKDLKGGTIRTLHPLSFVEDPARAIRAIRFEQKYAFRIEPFTMSLLKQTIREGLLEKIKPDRLKEEIQLILRLPEFYRYLFRLYQLDMFPFLFPGCIWKREYEEIYVHLTGIMDRFSIMGADSFLLKLSPLFGDMDPQFLSRFQERMSLSRKRINKIRNYLEKKEALEQGLQNTSLRNSQVYLLCSEIGLEFLLLTVAKYHTNNLVRERIERYIQEWSSTEPFLKGDDLRRMNIEEGPIYAKILQEVKLAKIDGEACTREEEEVLAKNLWERMKNVEPRKNL
ncbi:MAG: CBS domain-containing protein [Candidatus Caldatribacteriaceae bacterium]